MSLLEISPAVSRLRWFRMRSLAPAWALRLLPALALLLGASVLLALEPPSKPFLDKNSFFLSSAGFRVQLANDAAGKKALHALPPHRFVMHKIGDQVRYFYAEPVHCSCIFIGTPVAYDAYRDMLRQPLQQPDNVAPDYTTQATALLDGPPVWLNTLDEPDTLAEYFRDYY
jgi:hypothetical protein